MSTQLTLHNPNLITIPAPSSHQQNAAATYLARFTNQRTRDVISQRLAIMATIMAGQECSPFAYPWHALGYAKTNALRTLLVEAKGDNDKPRFAPDTVNAMLSALRGVLRTAWRLGLMDTDAYQHAVDIENLKFKRLPRGRAIPSGEVRALANTCHSDQTIRGARDNSILGILFACGLRREEVVLLDLADYNSESGEIQVMGKGNKERIVHIGSARSSLESWLEMRGEEPGPLFPPIVRGGHIQKRRMTPQSIYDIVKERAGNAGLKQSTSPHDARRTTATEMLLAGGDLNMVKDLLGHASVTTTQRYDKRGEESKRKTAELIHVPF